jgi:asparagine synthase (glutamine-hydrolysing)
MSQVPTHLLCKLTRGSVTVSLSGDGGDELFLGYNRYTFGKAFTRAIAPVPKPLRIPMGMLLSAAPAGLLAAVMPQSKRVAHPAQKIRKLADLLRYGDRYGIYHSLMSYWKDSPHLVPGAEGLAAAHAPNMEAGDPRPDMNLKDFLDYLPEDILTKVDRASMGVGLEARVPLLDHRVFEFAAKMPVALKTRDGKGKWPLRQLAYRYVPRELLDRPKKGFEVPIGAWLRGPLREWAEGLLSDRALAGSGFLHAAPIRRKWKEHAENRRDWTQELWNVLMFQAWHEHFR